MSIQFQRQFLMEDDAYGALKSTLISMGADEQSATMLVAAVEQGMLTPEKAVSIVKATATMEEEGGSMTAAAGATLEPVRVKKKVEEDAPILAGGNIEDNYAVSHFGYKKVPKGHAKMKGIIVKDLWKESSMNEILTPDDYKKAEALLDKLKNTNSKIYNAIIALVLDTYPHSGEEVEKLAAKAGLNENYHRFKKETATRTKAQQMHEAAKAIEKRLHEVNRLLEYTNELKSELFEGDSEGEMTHHTKKVLERVTKTIAEAYSKLKKIK